MTDCEKGWWETAGLFGSMIEYWHYTGDATYNGPIAQALLSQAGPSNDFMMPQTEGNDDQGWWALAAMSAAEYGLPSPAGAPTWLSLAQNVFNEFESRWDMTRCNGGMKWKIQPGADGYHYKSTISNGLAFQLAARLARFTGDQRYLQWASNAYDWTTSVGLIDRNFNVFDGTDDAKSTGCVDVNHDQWSYNVGVFMYGAAAMFDLTGDKLWSDRTAGLIGNSVATFFDNKIMFEKICEKQGTCNVDQLSFKAYLARWMAGTANLIPSFQAAILPFLQSSAIGAANACIGGGNGQMCGSRWYTNSFDGLSGVGEQMAALEIMHGSLVVGAAKPSAAGQKVMRTFIA
jgi:mannan endo-1,6-alpha-mannosidase